MDHQNIFYPSRFLEILGQSNQAKYITRYLNHLKVKSCILENNYVDKDYIIDYQKFYSRSFVQHDRMTKRLHFFSMKITEKKFNNFLLHYDVSYHKKLQKYYLGFVILKPIKNEDGDLLIGRTLLKTYLERENGKNRYYIRITNYISLYGIDLCIDSIPFQAQDRGVSACATVALWTALQTLVHEYEIPRISPVEITELSTSYLSVDRVFPQTGLTFEQMINCIKSLNMEVEVINLESMQDPEILTIASRAFLSVGIPLIVLIKLIKNTETVWHSVVITGYQSDEEGEIIELYIHDDQIGPYSKVEPNGNLLNWKNEWSNQGYSVQPELLMVPLYHKIRLSFNRMYAELIATRNVMRDGLRDIKVKLYLTSTQRYKRHLMKSDINNKINILKNPLSRYIWVLSYSLDEKTILDEIFDGTAVYPEIIETVEYL